MDPHMSTNGDTPQMSTEDAFGVLRDVAYSLSGTRQQHVLVDQALAVVAKALEAAKPRTKTG